MFMPTLFKIGEEGYQNEALYKALYTQLYTQTAFGVKGTVALLFPCHRKAILLITAF